MDRVIIASDGGCRGNGQERCLAAYGAVLILEGTEHKKEISAAFTSGTNNIMELKGFIEALKCLTRPCKITAQLDSKYVIDGCKSWLAGWKRNGWKTSTKKPVKNLELWQELNQLIALHDITYEWKRGHSGHELNERCDQLCNEAMDKLEKHLRGEV